MTYGHVLDVSEAAAPLDDPAVQLRIKFLAERANEGALDDDERSEYEALINAADFISILKIKTGRRLKSRLD